MPFAIAQVTPWPWEQHHEVNRFVERLSDELCSRGHRVVVVAPSDSRELVRDGRAKVRALRSDPDALWAEQGCASVVAVGQSLPFRRAGSVSMPLDVSRTLEDLLDRAELDFLHVHEPFAPSASSAALRHSRALNVGTFHSTTERFVSTQVARKVVELLFGRLDGRTASFAATRDLIERYFPGDYTVIRPGADLQRAGRRRRTVRPRSCSRTRRSAARCGCSCARSAASRRTSTGAPRSGCASRPSTTAPTLSRRMRERVTLAGPGDGSEAQHLARASIAVAASAGTAPAPQLVLRAMAGGAVPVVSRLPQYEELLRDGELGPLFEPRDALTLAAQIERLLRDPKLLSGYAKRDPGRPPRHQLVARGRRVRGAVRAHRRAPARLERPGAALRKKLGEKNFIHVDLHMHTDHSPDCATPVDTLLDTAKKVGLGAIAITDHNEISGALEARERANGIKVIVAEEVKTADQGEVIGLFIEEKIPRGMTLQETIAEIRRQGGLVYVPHPFDRMHAVPDYEHLLDVVEEIDAIEVFNPRVAFSAFNEEAARFAAKYRIVAGAGSDSHVAQGLGSVKIRMRDFDGPEEFLESLRDADIVRKRQSLLYVQALKFIQTRGKK